jgi:uncharacterized protein (TIGR02600 family)
MKIPNSKRQMPSKRQISNAKLQAWSQRQRRLFENWNLKPFLHLLEIWNLNFGISAPRKARRGVALICVLTVLVLLTILVVGFLIHARNTSTAVNYYRATAGTRMLADTAINLVQAQINQATDQGDNTHAWASQPGAIRVFNDSGELTQVRRLYSAATLTSSDANALQSDVPQPGWSASPALWVDLNAPAADTDGRRHFPILDARAPDTADSAGQIVAMDGFSINNAPDADDAILAPMPVRWLYVLQDGQIIAPDDASDTSATFENSGTAPSRENPIVGRIAFWTDDNTCKININTAGGQGVFTGSDATQASRAFWDTPSFASNDERGATVGLGNNFAQSQPVRGEYQRYPGHPATTNLQNALASLGFARMNTEDEDDFYSVTPRYNSGGSRGGTRYNTNSGVGAAINPSADRLYPSVAEMLFNTTVSGAERNLATLNPGASDSELRRRVETANFFLTAHSRAPELNLFGQPRVSIWPVSSNDNATYRTINDRMLAFAATITGTGASAGAPYYFTRAGNGATSSTIDIALPRNIALLNYLDRLAGTNIPGFGGSFYSKYTERGARQILTEVFDYIRVTNRFDMGIDPNNLTVLAPNRYAQRWTPWDGFGFGMISPSRHTGWNTQGIGAYPRLVEVTLQFIAVGQGGAKATTTFPPRPAQASIPVPLQVMSAGIIAKDSAIDSDGNPPNDKTAIQAVVMLTFVNPAVSVIPADIWLRVKIEGLNGLTYKGDSLGFPSSASMNLHDHAGFMGSDNSGYWSAKSMFTYHNFGPSTDMPHGHNSDFPFYSRIFLVDYNRQLLTTAQTMEIGDPLAPMPVPLTITLYDASGVNVVQTYRVDVPAFTAPVPTIPNFRLVGVGDGWGDELSSPPGDGNQPPAYNRWGVNNRVARGDNGAVYFDDKDVTRSMILAPAWSDPRLLALNNVPAEAFTPHPWWSPTRNHAHYLFWKGSNPFRGNSALSDNQQIGRLVRDAAYGLPGNASAPVMRPGFNGLADAGGQNDWDTGPGAFVDGPWINKADEGNMNAVDGNGDHFPYFFPNIGITQSLPDAYFSPNRQIPSPVMFGSLPTGLNLSGGTPRPWQTLLFRPRYGTHPGADAPADYLLLDWFWMPVIEPYAISEPFSTDGKVNLNYQIVPFTYINRATALRAVLASVKASKLPANLINGYKHTELVPYINANTRLPLNLDATISQFTDKFSNWEIFKSAAELCSLYLVPQGYELGGFRTQFNATDGTGDFAMIGDNLRERPYSHLYSRLTTKSNTFTVYYTVQTLKNANPDPTEWDETRGAVTGEYRGNTVLERYLDPNAGTRDFTNSANANYTLESDYRWRVISNAQFAP